MRLNFFRFSKNNIILGVLGLTLVLIHYLPANFKEVLIFDHQSPSSIAVFSTHFVHASNQHLIGNIFLGFTALFLLKYFFKEVGEDSIFRKITGVYLLFLPWFITSLSYLVFNLSNIDIQGSLGFSALALAFVGAIPATIFYYFKNSKIEKISVADSGPIFHIGLVFILTSYILMWLKSSTIIFELETVALLFLLTLGLLIYSEYRIMNLLDTKLGLSFKEFRNFFSEKEQIVLTFSFFIYIYGALSVAPFSGVVSDGGLVNIISHMTGFTLGFYVAELYLARN